jgi:hypothetical protein
VSDKNKKYKCTLADLASGSGLASNPPTGFVKITNIYINPATGEIVTEYTT